MTKSGTNIFLGVIQKNSEKLALSTTECQKFIIFLYSPQKNPKPVTDKIYLMFTPKMGRLGEIWRHS